MWPIQLGFMDLARVPFAWCERKQAFAQISSSARPTVIAILPDAWRAT